MHWVQLLLCVSRRDAKMKADLQKKDENLDKFLFKVGWDHSD